MACQAARQRGNTTVLYRFACKTVHDQARYRLRCNTAPSAADILRVGMFTNLQSPCAKIFCFVSVALRWVFIRFVTSCKRARTFSAGCRFVVQNRSFGSPKPVGWQNCFDKKNALFFCNADMRKTDFDALLIMRPVFISSAADLFFITAWCRARSPLTSCIFILLVATA